MSGLNPRVLKKFQDEQRKKMHADMKQKLLQFTQKDDSSMESTKAVNVSDKDKNMDEDLTGMGAASLGAGSDGTGQVV
jgi:hypothetical protein